MEGVSLDGHYENLDWGFFNAISNGGNQPGIWKTLKDAEWYYLLFTRNASHVCGTDNARFARAKVKGTNGLIIFPDVFNLPAGIPNIPNINTKRIVWTDTSIVVLDDDAWSLMEGAGVIFLPCTGEMLPDYGNRDYSGFNRNYREPYETGRYWSRSGYTPTSGIGGASDVKFDMYSNVGVPVGSGSSDKRRCSVRLVRYDYPNTTGFNQNGASNRTFSVADNKYVRFSRGPLQYTTTGTHSVIDGGTAIGTWRFAENQYDYIGNDDASPTYSGWIGVFGPGTSGWNSGVNAYQPWSTSENSGDYFNDEMVNNPYRDWGVYNAISNGGDQPGMWRTLKEEEFRYLLYTRNISARFAYVDLYTDTRNASMSSTSDDYISGILIFSDDFIMPGGVAEIKKMNSTAIATSVSDISLHELHLLENAGAIFFREYPNTRSAKLGKWLKNTSSGYGYARWYISGFYPSQVMDSLIYIQRVSCDNNAACAPLEVRLVCDVE